MSKKKKKNAGRTSLSPESASRAEPSPGKRFWMAMSLLALGFVLYGKTLHAPFVLDDVHKIQNNPDLRIERLPQVFSKLIYPYDLNPSFVRNDPSRPVTFLTYTLNYYFGKLDPFGYRLLNLLGHVAVGILLFFLTQRLLFLLFETHHVMISYFVALLFVVHPLNAIVALYSFNRADILAALTSLGALLLFFGPPPLPRWKKWGALALFVIGLGSKQTVAVLPLLLLVTDGIVVHRGQWASLRERLRVHLPFWIILAFYFIGRMAYFGSIGDLEAQSPWERGPYLITQIYSVVRYLQFILFPTGLSLDHMPEHYTSLMDPTILLSAGLLAGLAAIASAVIRRKTSASLLVLFSILWFGILLAPTSSFLPTTTALAENRLYLAEYGIILLAVFLLCAVFRIDLSKRIGPGPRWPCVVALGLPVALLGWLAYHRGLLFSDPFALWEDVLRVYPNQPRAMYCLGVLHYENKEPEKALAYYEKTVKLDPHYAEAYNNMGLIYANRWETEKSIDYFQKSVAAQPREKSYCNLGRAYASLKKYPEALAAFESALTLNPSSAQAYTLMGRVWYDQNDLPQARAYYQKAFQYAPDSHELQNNMGLISMAEKNYDEALMHLHEAVTAQPNYAEAYYHLAEVYSQMGQAGPSRENFDKACSLDPQYIFKPIQSGAGPKAGGTFQLPPNIQKYLNSLSSPGH